MPIPWVVKLGGSLAGADDLPLWLEALAATGAVIVPGGGPFADAVRRAQARWGFGDGAAHAMAILAMRQYGLMLAALHPGFSTATDIGALAGGPAVWLPDPETVDPGEVPASWEITSDSLAAWLAHKLGAKHLLLVKSAAIPPGSVPAALAVAEGWIDTAFPAYLAGAGCSAWLCRRQDHAVLGEGFRQPGTVFTRVVAGAAIPREVNPYGDQSPLFREPA